MPSFGETLQRERESQSKTLEEMAEATGIGISFLQALENEEIGALPGRAFGKLYIRAYAEVLGFDPRPVLEDYDRPQNLPQQATAPSAESSAPRPVGAALARWREARMAELQKQERVADLGDAPEAAIPDPPDFEVEGPFERGDAPREPAAAAPDLEVEGPVEHDEVPPPSVPPIPRTSPRSSRGLRGLLVLGLVAGAAGACFLLLRPRSEPTSTVSPTQETRPAPPSEPLPGPVDEPPSAPSSSPPRPAPKATTSPAHLTVSEFGVGRRIVGQRLEGQDNRFRSGERVVFSTRVLGGRAGERIRHVWIHEERTQQSIRLRLGGATWRTHSSKTLGRAGEWTVEARDEEGRVLARATFLCTP